MLQLRIRLLYKNVKLVPLFVFCTGVELGMTGNGVVRRVLESQREREEKQGG
jgi:hypothetical protein